MLETLNAIDGFVWGPPLLVLLIGTGLMLTVRLHLLQVFRLPRALKLIFTAKNQGEGDVDSFKALCTALAATVGTGNVDGRFRRHGHEIRRRLSGRQISHGRQERRYCRRPDVLHRKRPGQEI